MDNQTPKNTKKTKKNNQKEKKESKLSAKTRELTEKFVGTKFGSALSKHFERQGYLYCAFLIPVALFFMVFILQRTYPFGNGSVLILDLNGQYVYFFEALRKAIYGDASFLYTWMGTLGGEFIGIYAYYIASPLSYIVALFPETAMTEAILVIELLKCGLSGLTMAYYLKKTRPKANEMITISIAVMYALCSYAIVMAHNTMWIDALLLLPLIVYGLEMLINKGRFVLFTVSLALSILSNFYIGYMTCIFVFVYFFYYYFFASDGYNNFTGERGHFIKSLIRVGVAAVAAILIACVIIIPTAYSLTLGKTTFSKTDWSFSFKFTPIDFIMKLFIASFDTVRPEGLPFIYCGMLTLILIPIFFISKRISKRQKIGAACILSFFFLSMIISPLDLIWHGFQNPNWLNHRYSFMLSFVMLTLAHRAFELFHTVKLKKTLIIASVWGALVILCSFFTKDQFFKNFARQETLFILIPIFFLVLYVAAHHFLLKERFNKAARSSLLTTLAIIICFEMFIGCLLNTTSLNDDVTFSPKYTGEVAPGLEGYDNFLDKMRPVVNEIQENDTSFYRMEQEIYRKACDNFALNIRGVTGSTSTLNAKTIKFLNNLGFVAHSQWSRYKGSTSVADSLLGIKYIITASTKDQNDYYLTDLVEKEYDENKYLYYYRNIYALSIAYMSSEDIKDYNIYDSTSPFVTMNNLITALLGEDETVEVFKEIEYTFDYDKDKTRYNETLSGQKSEQYVEVLYDKDGNPIPDLDENGNIQYKDNGEIKYKTENTPYHTFTMKNADEESIITFTITMPSDINPQTEIFFTLPTKYNRTCKWTFTSPNLAGGETDTVVTGDCFENETDCIQSLGLLNPNSTATLEVKINKTNDDPTQNQLYIDASSNTGIFYYVDEDLYKDVMTRLAEGNFNIEEYTETSFKGTVTASEGKTTMFTTIPYEKYWDVKVDGKSVETYSTCAALLAFDVGSEGQHTIEIVYNSKALKTGAIMTLAGLVILVSWAVADRIFFMKKRENELIYDYDSLSNTDYESDEYDEEIEARKKKRKKFEKRGK